MVSVKYDTKQSTDDTHIRKTKKKLPLVEIIKWTIDDIEFLTKIINSTNPSKIEIIECSNNITIFSIKNSGFIIYFSEYSSKTGKLFRMGVFNENNQMVITSCDKNVIEFFFEYVKELHQLHREYTMQLSQNKTVANNQYSKKYR